MGLIRISTYAACQLAIVYFVSNLASFLGTSFCIAYEGLITPSGYFSIYSVIFHSMPPQPISQECASSFITKCVT